MRKKEEATIPLGRSYYPQEFEISLDPEPKLVQSGALFSMTPLSFSSSLGPRLEVRAESGKGPISILGEMHLSSQSL